MGAAHILWSTGSNSPSATCCWMATSTFSCSAKGMGELLQNLGSAPPSVQSQLPFQLTAPVPLGKQMESPSEGSVMTQMVPRIDGPPDHLQQFLLPQMVPPNQVWLPQMVRFAISGPPSIFNPSCMLITNNH